MVISSFFAWQADTAHFYPTFNARGKLRAHYSLPQAQQVFEVFYVPPGVSHKRGSISGARQQLRAAPGLCWNCLNNVGGRREQLCLFSQFHPSVPPAGAGQEGPAEPL